MQYHMHVAHALGLLLFGLRALAFGYCLGVL